MPEEQSLRGFLDFVERQHPEHLLRIKEPVRRELEITSAVFEIERAGHDPVLVFECGVGDDVLTVVVDGRTVLENRRIDGIDVAALRNEAQVAAEGIWAGLPEWDPLGRSAEEAAPWSFPLA